VSGDPARGWVTTSQAGPVLTVLLDRADQLNAQVPATWTTLAEVGAALPADVRVVVVRGAGRAFSAGLDRSLFAADPATPGGLGELAGLGPEGAQERIRGYQAGFRWLRQPGIVSVAVVQGHAIGAGAQLALACDLRVCAEEATFALPEATLGLVPDLTGTSTLVQAVGYSRALEMCLTGRRVGAAEAYAAGLANVVVPAGQLDAAVDQLVTAVLGPDVDASRETAALVRRAAAVDDEGQDAAERAAQVRRLHALAEQASPTRG
jgi:enoyl-CoA hydratase/carnithine racemase